MGGPNGMKMEMGSPNGMGMGSPMEMNTDSSKGVCYLWNSRLYKGPGPYQPNGPTHPYPTECGIQNCQVVQMSQCIGTPVEPKLMPESSSDGSSVLQMNGMTMVKRLNGPNAMIMGGIPTNKVPTLPMPPPQMKLGTIMSLGGPSGMQIVNMGGLNGQVLYMGGPNGIQMNMGNLNGMTMNVGASNVMKMSPNGMQMNMNGMMMNMPVFPSWMH